MAEYMQSVLKYGIYVILENTELTGYSVFDLNWTDVKAEAILKIQFSYCRKPHYRPYDGLESHLDG